MRTKSIDLPSRENSGDSSAQPAGGAVNCRFEPSKPMRQSSQRVAKKFALSLSACDCTTTDRLSGAQTTDPHAREGDAASGFRFHEGALATRRRLWFVATRSLPAVKTSRPPHHVR